MTEQELLQENEKLNARLQKAIAVFGEQKNNITRLTEERDAANAEVDRLKGLVAEFESKMSAVAENDEKFFEQLQEIDTLKSTISSKDNALNAIQSQLTVVTERSADELTKLQERLEAQLADKNNQLKQLETEAGGLKLQLDGATQLLAQNEELANQKLKALNDIIDESNNENTALKERLEKAAKLYEANKEQIEQLTNDLASAQTELSEMKTSKETLSNELLETTAKVESLQSELKAAVSTVETTKTQVSATKAKVEQLTKLGSDLMSDFNMFG